MTEEVTNFKNIMEFEDESDDDFYGSGDKNSVEDWWQEDDHNYDNSDDIYRMEREIRKQAIRGSTRFR